MKIVILIICCFYLATLAPIVTGAKNNSQNDAPLVTKFEEKECRSDSNSESIAWHAKAVLPRNLYSRDTIEKLFQWYLRRHSNDSIQFRFEIYFEDKIYESIQVCVDSGVVIVEPVLPTDPTYESYLKEKKEMLWQSPVAVFSRGLKEMVDSPDNAQSYFWRPDPAKEDKEFIKVKSYQQKP